MAFPPQPPRVAGALFVTHSHYSLTHFDFKKTSSPFHSLNYLLNTIGNNIIIMMRLTTLLIVLLGSSSTAAAYTVSPQRSSYFVGHSVYHTTAASAPQTSSSRVTSSNLTMKKGKANVPPQMRSQYARAQEMENYRQQMMESQRMGADGLPVFNLYVRTSLKNVSYVACCFISIIIISLLWILSITETIFHAIILLLLHPICVFSPSTYFLLQKQLATTQYYSTK